MHTYIFQCGSRMQITKLQRHILSTGCHTVAWAPDVTLATRVFSVLPTMSFRPHQEPKLNDSVFLASLTWTFFCNAKQANEKLVIATMRPPPEAFPTFCIHMPVVFCFLASSTKANREKCYYCAWNEYSCWFPPLTSAMVIQIIHPRNTFGL